MKKVSQSKYNDYVYDLNIEWKTDLWSMNDHTIITKWENPYTNELLAIAVYGAYDNSSDNEDRCLIKAIYYIAMEGN